MTTSHNNIRFTLKNVVAKKDIFNDILEEYQKILNLLNKTNNQPSEFRTREWVVADEVSKADKQIDFYTLIPNLSP